MHSSRSLVKLVLTIVSILTMIPLNAQVGSDQSFECFPTCSEVDSRMLSLGSEALSTVAGFEIGVAIAIDGSAADFEIGIFDGDTGRNTVGGPDCTGEFNGDASCGTWDQGVDELTYTLLADPDGDGLGTVVAQWKGNSMNPPSGLWTSTQLEMPDNDWWNALIQTSPDAFDGSSYRYFLRIANQTPSADQVSSNFKLRVTGGMVVRSTDTAWGVQSAVRVVGGPSARILYPQWDGIFPGPDPNLFLTTPTTYDGVFTFTFEVPDNQTELRIFDGDFDFGSLPGATGVFSGGPIQECVESDDPNTGLTPPDFAMDANSEGEAQGNPHDDSRFDIFRREPCVIIEVSTPPDAMNNVTVYRNENPSGDFEWEEFVVTSVSAPNSVADYSTDFAADGVTFVPAGFLPSGEWTLTLRGLDVGNTVFLSGPDVAGIASASIGDRVWLDANGDGVQDDPNVEPGIGGVTVRLYRDDGDGVFDPSLDALIREEMTDADGEYLFEGLGGGDYFVVVASVSFDPGIPGPLLGAEQTFDFNGALDNLASVSIEEEDEFLLADFGYRFGTIGDLVWLDSNANGVFEPEAGEIGISGVVVDLSSNNLNDDETTEVDGFYLFAENPNNPSCSDCGLPAGTYQIVVRADNFNSGGPLFGLIQTFDNDGFLDNQTTHDLAEGENFLDADFGYRPLNAGGAGTPGYWKNHPEAWPVEEITIGGVVYTKDAAIALLNEDESGDKTFALFSHLVAAKLNVGTGNDWSCIDPEILQADQWLSFFPVGSGVAASSAPWQRPTNGLPSGRSLKDVLDRYNNGRLSCAGGLE